MTPRIQLALALVLLAAALGGYGTEYAAVERASAAAADLSSQIETMNDSAARLASARTAFADLASDESAVGAYFVSEAGIVDFIDGLEARGKAQGVAVAVRSVSANKDAAHPALNLSLSFAGSFDAVMRVAGAIEYAPYDLAVNALSISHDNASTTKAWRADLDLTVGTAAAATTPAVLNI